MDSRRLAPFIGGGLLLVPPSLAQYGGICFASPSPAQAVLGIDAMAAGHFTSPHYADLVTLSGDDLEVVYGIGRLESEELVHAGVRSFAVLEGAGAEPGLDAVACLDQAGLVGLKIGYGGGLTRDLASSAEGPWVGASRLKSLLDGGGVAAISADGQQVIVGAAGEWSTPTVFECLGESVLDIAPLDWDGDGSTELAVLERSGTNGGAFMTVRELDGTPVPGALWSSLDVHNVLLRIPEFDSGGDALFWVTEPVPGAVYGITLKSEGMEHPLSFGSERIDSLALVRWDDDDHPDLVVASTNRCDAWVYSRSTAENTAPFTPGAADEAYIVLRSWAAESTGPAPYAASASPLCAVADVDSDGDDDLVFTRRSAATPDDLWVTHNARACSGDTSLSDCPTGVLFTAEQPSNPAAGCVLKVRVPTGNGANSVGVSVFRQPFHASPVLVAQEDYPDQRIPLSGGGSTEDVTIVLVPNQPLPPGDATDVLHVVVEPQFVEDDGTVVKVFPPAFFHVARPSQFVAIACWGWPRERLGIGFRRLADNSSFSLNSDGPCTFALTPEAECASAPTPTETGGIVQGTGSRRRCQEPPPPPPGG